MADRIVDIAFVDLDGTLLSDDLTVSEENNSAIRSLVKNGVEVVLASGRPTQALHLFVEELSVSPIVISSNGASMVDTRNNDVLFSSSINEQALSKIIQFSEKLNLSTCYYTPSTWFVKKIDHLVEIEISRANIYPIEVPPQEIPGEIIKCMVIGNKDILADCERYFFESGLSSYVHWFYTYPEYLEVMPIGITKRKSRDVLLKKLGVDMARVFAIGDGINDIDLVDGVGISVAMENSKSDLKRHVKYITRSNNENGVAVAIKHLIFGQQELAPFIKRTS